MVLRKQRKKVHLTRLPLQAILVPPIRLHPLIVPEKQESFASCAPAPPPSIDGVVGGDYRGFLQANLVNKALVSYLVKWLG